MRACTNFILESFHRDIWTDLSSRARCRRRKRTPSQCDAPERPNLSVPSRRCKTRRGEPEPSRRTEPSPEPGKTMAFLNVQRVISGFEQQWISTFSCWCAISFENCIQSIRYVVNGKWLQMKISTIFYSTTRTIIFSIFLFHSSICRFLENWTSG